MSPGGQPVVSVPDQVPFGPSADVARIVAVVDGFDRGVPQQVLAVGIGSLACSQSPQLSQFPSERSLASSTWLSSQSLNAGGSAPT